jgi:peptidoglycan/LPS O-acetylase OafA/YrhL
MFFFGIGLINFVMFIQTTAYDDFRNGFKKWGTYETAFFVATERIMFAVSLSCVMLPCLLGFFPLLSEFLGSKIWAPLARMSYCVYLMHMIIIATTFLGMQSTFYWSSANLITEFIAFVVFSYVAGFCLSMLVEVPFMNLEKVLFARSK